MSNIQSLKKVRIRLIIGYLLYILYEFLWVPLELFNKFAPWNYSSHRIHYSIVFPKLITLAVIFTLIYFGIRYRQLSQINKEQCTQRPLMES